MTSRGEGEREAIREGALPVRRLVRLVGRASTQAIKEEWEWPHWVMRSPIPSTPSGSGGCPPWWASASFSSVSLFCSSCRCLRVRRGGEEEEGGVVMLTLVLAMVYRVVVGIDLLPVAGAVRREGEKGERGRAETEAGSPQ